MYLKKKKYVIVVLAGLIALAVYLNVVYTDSNGMFDITETVSPASSDLGETAEVSAPGANLSAEGAGAQTDPAIAQARLTRQKSRDEAAFLLKEVINNESLSEEDKSKAAEKLDAMADAILAESSVENLVRAKGFADCAAYITDGSVTLTVKADGLEKTQIAQLKDIVITQTGISADKIKILEIK
ncbi:MAG: SpoIIIAH-like family protein [Clostridia bacterium]|nr:SpoIIIAH-like family protein [Clostridia bacterium]